MVLIGYEYMDEILARKMAGPTAHSLRSEAMKALWNQLTASMDSGVWNIKCERLQAAKAKIVFYSDPAPTLEEIGNKGRRDGVELDVEFHSVFAETFARTFLGHPKKRVYIWMTRSAPARILFNYGEACSYNAANELPVTVHGAQVSFPGSVSEPEFLDHSIRKLLQPLLEV